MKKETTKIQGKKRGRLPWWGAILASVCMLAILWHQNHWQQTSLQPEKPPAATNWIQGYQAALMHKQQIKKQWIVNNVHCGDHWKPRYYKKNLGSYRVLPKAGNNEKSCYFPEADMTFVINSKSQEVVTLVAGQNNQ